MFEQVLLFAGHDQVSRVACLKDRRAHATRQQHSRALRRRAHVAHLDVGQHLRLGGVRSDHVDQTKQLLRERHRRRWIEQRLRAAGLGEPQRGFHRAQRNLEVYHQHSRERDALLGDLDLGLGELPVRSGRGDDLLLALMVDGDQRDAGGSFAISDDMAFVHAGLSEPRDQRVASRVDADATHECDLRSQARCTNGLVGSLTAGALLKDLTFEGFPRDGEPRSSDDVVEVSTDGPDSEGNIQISARAEGDSYVLRVVDSGLGVPAEIHDKIFEPFFTTKPVGKGTGLGLSIASAVVKKHEGTLTLTPAAKGGTEAVIRIPLSRVTLSRRR